MKRLVAYLDEMTKQEDLNAQNYQQIIIQINNDYYRNNIQNVAGGIPEYPRYLPGIFSYSNSYELWQKQHETDVSILDANLLQNKPLHKKHIDANVETIDDLLKIIDENPLEKNTEYNIQLALLHRIRTELVELNGMVGMKKLKTAVLDQLLYFMQGLHLGSVGDFKHTVLYGPPGTGKTEVAKLIGAMFSKIGVLSKNIFKKAVRSDLIAGYLGQTAIKTQKLVDSCLGGVLFIDEAYSLAAPDQSDSYSKECIDTLCEALSNHKNDLMVIIAGYEEELSHTFFKANSGLESRFVWRFKMEPYNAKELCEIFLKKVKQSEWKIDTNIEETALNKWFEKNKASFPFYGRDMENLFMYTKIAHGRRIYGQPQEMMKILNMQDLEQGLKTFLQNGCSKVNKPPPNMAILGMYC